MSRQSNGLSFTTVILAIPLLIAGLGVLVIILGTIYGLTAGHSKRTRERHLPILSHPHAKHSAVLPYPVSAAVLTGVFTLSKGSLP